MKKLLMLTLTMIIASSTMNLEAVIVRARPVVVDPYARAAVRTPYRAPVRRAVYPVGHPLYRRPVAEPVVVAPVRRAVVEPVAVAPVRRAVYR